MKPITDTELDTLLVAVHDGTQGSYSENLRAGVDKLLEQRAAWREPTAEDWENAEPVQMLWWDSKSERRGPITCVLASRRYLTRPGIGRGPCKILIAQPQALPGAVAAEQERIGRDE